MVSTRAILSVIFFLLLKNAHSEECEEEVLTHNADGEKCQEYITYYDPTYYEGVLSGGTLVVPPPARSNILEEHLQVGPKNAAPSYAYRNLTEISFTAEGITNGIVWLVVPEAQLRLHTTHISAREPGLRERFVIDGNQFQTFQVEILLYRHQDDVIKVYDMVLKACKE